MRGNGARAHVVAVHKTLQAIITLTAMVLELQDYGAVIASELRKITVVGVRS